MMLAIYFQYTLIVLFLCSEYLLINAIKTSSCIRRIIIDEIMHIIFYISIAFPLLISVDFIWGIASSVLIDIDHFISAKSFSPEKTLHLENRPYTHSLLFALFVSSFPLILGNTGICIFIFIGLVSHLLRDLITDTTPVLYPFAKKNHIPFFVFIILTLILSGIISLIYLGFSNILL